MRVGDQEADVVALHGLTPQDHEVLRPLGKEAGELLAQQLLRVVRLPHPDTHLETPSGMLLDAFGCYLLPFFACVPLGLEALRWLLGGLRGRGGPNAPQDTHGVHGGLDEALLILIPCDVQRLEDHRAGVFELLRPPSDSILLKIFNSGGISWISLASNGC